MRRFITLLLVIVSLVIAAWLIVEKRGKRISLTPANSANGAQTDWLSRRRGIVSRKEQPSTIEKLTSNDKPDADASNFTQATTNSPRLSSNDSTNGGSGGAVVVENLRGQGQLKQIET